MTNKEIYEVLEKLGMVESYGEKACCCADEPDHRTESERFAEDTCADLVSIMNFVDDLTTYNDLETIRKFLVCLLHSNKTKEK